MVPMCIATEANMSRDMSNYALRRPRGAAASAREQNESVGGRAGAQVACGLVAFFGFALVLVLCVADGLMLIGLPAAAGAAAA